MPTEDELNALRKQMGELFLAGHLEKHDMEQQKTVDAFAAHEKLHDALAVAHDQMHTADERAVTAATRAMDKRLDAMNEFRDQLRDQAATFVRRADLEAVEKAGEVRYEEMRSLIATEREERRGAEGAKRGVTMTTGIIVTAIGVVGTILGIIIVLSNVLTNV